MPKYAKLQKPIFHCQTPLKNASFELFGILKCQLATLISPKTKKWLSNSSERIGFDDIWQKYPKDSKVECVFFSFHVGLLFISFSSFKRDKENNANLDAVSSAPTLTRCNFLKHVPKLTIFGIHNLQIFRYNTLINE